MGAGGAQGGRTEDVWKEGMWEVGLEECIGVCKTKQTKHSGHWISPCENSMKRAVVSMK